MAMGTIVDENGEDVVLACGGRSDGNNRNQWHSQVQAKDVFFLPPITICFAEDVILPPISKGKLNTTREQPG